MPTLATFIQHSIGSPSHSNQTRKRKKRNLKWKGRCNCGGFALFSWSTTFYLFQTMEYNTSRQMFVCPTKIKNLKLHTNAEIKCSKYGAYISYSNSRKRP